MGNKKKTLIIVLIVVVPVIVGVITFFGYKLGWFKSKAAVSPKEYMYSIGDFTVNLDEPNYKRYMKVTIYVGSDSKNLEAEITEKMPKIKGMITDILRAKKLDDVNTPEKTETIKKEIKDKTNPVLTAGKINNVYLNDILIQ